MNTATNTRAGCSAGARQNATVGGGARHAAAVSANIVGIYLLGSVAGWEQWLAAASGYFLVWRLCLYGATAYGWVWMRRRLLAPQKTTSRRGGADATSGSLASLPSWRWKPAC